MPLDSVPVGPRARIEALVARAAEIFNIDPVLVMSPVRDRPVARARWAVWVVMRDKMGMSMAQIGRACRVDHTTVLHALRKTGEIMADDPAYAAKVQALGQGVTMVPFMASDPMPPPSTALPPVDVPVASELDYLVLDRLLRKVRNKMVNGMRRDLSVFRRRYAKTYDIVREALK